MQTFKQYLTEAKDITRFIHNNKFLDDKKIEIINKFFTQNKKASRWFELNVGWQSGKPATYTWRQWQDIMKFYKIGRRLLLKYTKIPGKEGEDYQNVPLRNKDYIANIPLNFRIAEYMNSCEYGVINVNFCIGNKRDYGKRYWNEYVLEEKQIPVYIVNGIGKWVIMVFEDGYYTIWDKFNNEDISMQKNPIPGIDVKKEIIKPVAKIYNELIEKITKQDEDFFYFEDTLEEAEEEYEEFFEEVKKSIEKYLEDMMDYYYYEYMYLETVRKKLDEIIVDEFDEYPESLIDLMKELREDDTVKYTGYWGDVKDIVIDFFEKYNIKEEYGISADDILSEYEPVEDYRDIYCDFTDYPTMVYVLEKQGHIESRDNYKKMVKDIKMDLYYLVNEMCLYYDDCNMPTDTEISEVLEKYGIYSPKYSDELY